MHFKRSILSLLLVMVSATSFAAAPMSYKIWPEIGVRCPGGGNTYKTFAINPLVCAFQEQPPSATTPPYKWSDGWPIITLMIDFDAQTPTCTGYDIEIKVLDATTGVSTDYFNLSTQTVAGGIVTLAPMIIRHTTTSAIPMVQPDKLTYSFAGAYIRMNMIITGNGVCNNNDKIRVSLTYSQP